MAGAGEEVLSDGEATSLHVTPSGMAAHNRRLGEIFLSKLVQPPPHDATYVRAPNSLPLLKTYVEASAARVLGEVVLHDWDADAGKLVITNVIKNKVVRTLHGFAGYGITCEGDCA